MSDGNMLGRSAMSSAWWCVDYGNQERHGVADSTDNAVRAVGDCLARRADASSITIVDAQNAVWYWEMPNDWDVYAPVLIKEACNE